jgi:S-adenosylmethionine-diacylglycerol 3-amino-3-carboxypropyl transferase
MTITDELSSSRNARLVGRAVHRHRALSADGLRERAFTLLFTHMVYPQIWEDPEIDLEALALQPDSRVVTIASGGCNVMSYLAHGPQHIYAVDLNATHLALLRLKLAAAHHLPDHSSFDRFFRNARDVRNVRAYDTFLRPHLDSATRLYWDGRDALGRRRVSRFRRGFYRYGLLGRFIGIAHLLTRLQGRDLSKLLSARSLGEQRRIFETDYAPLFDRPLMKRLLDSPFSLFGLGIPPAQFSELCNGHGKASSVVRERLRRLACDFEFDANYFAWQAFNRGYASDKNGPVPPYLDERNYKAIKLGTSRVTTAQINLIEFLSQRESSSLDRYVLLDAQDWMSDGDLGRLWQHITRTARTGARVIFRTAAAHSPLPGRVPTALLERWTYHATKSGDLHRRDRSAIYGGFHLYTLDEALQ